MKLGRYIVGLISGLTFGMLFAPKKGKELRKELLKKGKNGTDPCESCHEGLKVLGGAFKEAGEEAWKEIKELSEHEQVSALLELSQDKMKSFLEAAEEKGYDVATQLQDKLEELTDLVKEKADEVKVKAVEAEKKAVKKAVKAKKNLPFSKRKSALKKKKAVKKAAPKKAKSTAKKIKAKKVAKKASKK